jgi:hypothetical protein
MNLQQGGENQNFQGPAFFLKSTFKRKMFVFFIYILCFCTCHWGQPSLMILDDQLSLQECSLSYLWCEHVHYDLKGEKKKSVKKSKTKIKTSCSEHS